MGARSIGSCVSTDEHVKYTHNRVLSIFCFFKHKRPLGIIKYLNISLNCLNRYGDDNTSSVTSSGLRGRQCINFQFGFAVVSIWCDT